MHNERQNQTRFIFTNLKNKFRIVEFTKIDRPNPTHKLWRVGSGQKF